MLISFGSIYKKVRRVAKEVLGVSKGFGLRDKESWAYQKKKESWWWNDSVKEKVKYKMLCFFKALHERDNARCCESCE